MASSEWMELETLSQSIADSQGRLEAAKSVGSFELAQVIEKEIAAMEERRTQVLGHLANVITGTGEQKDNSEPAEGAQQEIAEAEPEKPEVVDPANSRKTSLPEPDTNNGPEPSTYRNAAGRPGIVWNQLVQADVERAKRDLSARRAEMLARHAEELKTLDADKAEIDTLEQAIDGFLRKFSGLGGGGEVVPLKQQRPSRLQAG